MATVILANTTVAQLLLNSGERVLISINGSRRTLLGKLVPLIRVFQLDLKNLSPGQVTLLMVNPDVLILDKKIWESDFNSYFFKKNVVRINSERTIIPTLIKDFSQYDSIAELKHHQ